MNSPRSRYYTTVIDFAAAVHLTFDNGITYNGRESDIGHHARRLKKIFDRLLTEWVDGSAPLNTLNDDCCQACKMPWEHKPEQLMLCEGCDAPYHTFCCNPPLKNVPTSDWFCVRCRLLAIQEAKQDKLRAAADARAAKAAAALAAKNPGKGKAGKGKGAAGKGSKPKNRKVSPARCAVISLKRVADVPFDSHYTMQHTGF